jgi:hypothetical protein
MARINYESKKQVLNISAYNNINSINSIFNYVLIIIIIIITIRSILTVENNSESIWI